MKVSIIEDSETIDTLNIDKLFGSIQTYELTLEPSKKNKSVAFRTTRKEIYDSDDDEPLVLHA